MQSFWEFINESEYVVKMKDLQPTNDIEKNIYDKRFNIKSNFDMFLSDVNVRKAYKQDQLKILSTKRKNEGIFAENIARIIFQGENLNHFTKNHPYVDIAVMNPIEGITKKNELISVKSTLEYSTVAKILADTKAIKFESLITYLIYAYNLYKNISQPFSINELQKGVIKWLEGRKISITQEQYKNIIYIIIYHIIKYTKEFSQQPLGKFEQSLIDDVEDYLDEEIDISEIKDFVKKEINKLYYPVSLSVVFIGPSGNKELKDIDPQNILNVYKTNSIPLGEFFFRVMKKWYERGFFGSKNEKGKYVTKYLRFNDILEVFGTDKNNLFPTKIHIDFTDFEGKERGNKRKRLYIATELKDAYFDEYEDEALDAIYKMIQELEKDPSKVKKFKDFIQ